MGLNVIIQALYVSGPVATFVFSVLIVLSVISWGLIIGTIVYYKRLATDDKKFLDEFAQAEKPADLYHKQLSEEETKKKGAGIKAIFTEIYHEVVLVEKHIVGLNFVDPKMQTIKANFDEIIQRTLEKVKSKENAKRERFLSFFATVSNIAPFIGLMGTVIGIIDAFAQIGKIGSADLGFVAPAISEALVATAAGLFVAIPSSIAFNYFKFQSSKFRDSFDQFSLELLNKIQQQYFFKELSDD